MPGQEYSTDHSVNRSSRATARARRHARMRRLYARAKNNPQRMAQLDAAIVEKLEALDQREKLAKIFLRLGAALLILACSVLAALDTPTMYIVLLASVGLLLCLVIAFANRRWGLYFDNVIEDCLTDIEMYDVELFEMGGIERVPESYRAHTELWDTMWLWWSANSVVATVALGAINVFFGLGFLGSVIVIVLFNVLGALPVAFLCTLGPKSGLAQMALSRFAFGLQGAKLPAVLNALSCLGWSAVNAVIGSRLLVAWSASKIPSWAALLFLTAVTTAITIFGYFVVHRYERYAWIPMFLLFGYIFYVAAPHFNINVPTSASGLALFAGIATFGGAVFGYAVSWATYSADYTRRQPIDTPPQRIFWYAFLGVTIPCILLETLGVLLTTTLAAGNELPDIGVLISDVIGGSAISSLVLFLLAFSTVANNVLNDYSFALSTQVAGLKIRRWILTIIGPVTYLALAFYLQTNFNLNLENFLLLIAYWIGSWSAIVLIEHWLRKGKYPAEDYEAVNKLPVGIASVAAMILGLGIAALGVSQQLFTGPLARQLAGADIGFPLAIAATGVIYFVLRLGELVYYKR
jgi:NCS1 nucleoside transporter family